MIEYRPRVLQGNEVQGDTLPYLLPPLDIASVFVKQERARGETQASLLTELRRRMSELKPEITTDVMTRSIKKTLKLSNEELKIIIPKDSSPDHIANSFVGLWYIASNYPQETFAKDMRVKHDRHESFGTTEPTSYLDLVLKKGVTPVLMVYYEMFNPGKPTTEPAPQSPAQ